MSTLAERRAAIEAKLSQLEDERSARAAAEAEEREVADLEALYKLRVEHGDNVGTLDTDLGMIAFRRPTSIEFRRFQDRAKFDSESVEKLVRPCVLYPSKTSFDSVLGERPGVLVELGDLVVGLAQARSNARSGKSQS